MRNFWLILATFGLSYLVAVIGGWVTTPALGGWYAELQKPDFNPPNWIFGPVWSVLYTFMGLAAYLVVKRGWGDQIVRWTWALHLGQLAMNLLWSYVFFGYQQLYNALIVLLLLWILVAGCVIVYWQRSRVASVLMLVYLFWVSFAGILSYAVWRLN